jgi:hypothetical protein
MNDEEREVTQRWRDGGHREGETIPERMMGGSGNGETARMMTGDGAPEMVMRRFSNAACGN